MAYFFTIVQVDAVKWTPHSVELAVWTYYLLYHHNQDALNAAAIFSHTRPTEEEVKNIQWRPPTCSHREVVEVEEEGNTDQSASLSRRLSSDEEPLTKKLKV